MMAISLKGIAMQKTVFGLLLSWMALSVWAQPPSGAQPAKPQTKVQAKGHAKSAAPRIAKAPAKPVAAVLPATLAALPLAEAHMGVDELAIAERVHKGRLSCELGASVRVEADASHPGYFDLHGKGFHYRMHPVATSTGAIRLEDPKRGAMWLQLGNKSMLMSQRLGQRLADECQSPEQATVAADMKKNPPTSILEPAPAPR